MKAIGQIRTNALMCTSMQTRFTVELYGDHVEELEKLRDKDVDIEIKLHREKRSISANNLLWELCTQIGNAVRPAIPKEDVYRRAIRDVGDYVQICIWGEDWERFERTWSEKGVGWFAEIVDDSHVAGHIDVMAYAGTSTYDTLAMSRVIDYLVYEAQQMELPIGHELNEIEQIKNDWAKKKEANS